MARANRAGPAHSLRGWAVAGTVLGALCAMLAFAPASWLAAALATASDERLLLADARGPWWQGSAVAVLTGGAGSRDASTLPGRLHWSIAPALSYPPALQLTLRQTCCIEGDLHLRIEPGLGRWRVALPVARATLGHWPAAWLSGLGTPFNTLELGGALRLAGEGLAIESVQGRWRLSGRAELEALSISSRLSTLASLGSYRVDIVGAAAGGDGATLNLSTLDGALRLVGSGQFRSGHLQLRGEARADAGSEAVLNNLLNIIGRRQGAMSVISIG